MKKTTATPLHQQIYQRVKHQVAEGMLVPGQRMPSSRAMAGELGIARGTVEAAYDRLVGEGWLVAHGPAGTFVADVAPIVNRRDAVALRPTVKPTPHAQPQLLRLGLPALDAFPRKLWARLVARQARAAGSFGLPAPAGHPPLRAAIAAYLPLPVDDDGIVVAEGVQRARRARLAVVTPSHQSPLGVALGLARRTALLAWARAANAHIVEDDYDGEYRYAGHPLPALQSLDTDGRVIYLGTFSKVLFPGLRLAYAVVPEAKVDAFDAASARSLHAGCPELYQAVVADFLQQGHFARHVKKMRTLYASRRDQLTRALAVLEPEGLTVEQRPGGMHLVIRSQRPEPDTELARRAQAAGFAVQALSTWACDGQGPQGLLAGFANVTTEAEAHNLARRLRRAIVSA